MNWMKYKSIYFLISGLMFVVVIFGLVKWGVVVGVDFTGGTVIEYRIEGAVSTEQLSRLLSEKGLDVTSIQSIGNSSYLIKFPPIDNDQRQIVEKTIRSNFENQEVQKLQFEVVGPSIGPEMVKKTVYAVSIAAVLILLWVAYQFKNVEYGVSAILAMLHDSFILSGSYSLLGHFWGAEVDFLLVTAVLTTLSFSVHDTIVVFDRVREIRKKEGGDLIAVANRALTETMVRSLNNSFTIAFMLIALVLLGGTTIRWFAVALLIGTLLGTYSSPFVAVPLLVTFSDLKERLKKK